jgi:uncharacterized protein (TIGR00369 family)
MATPREELAARFGDRYDASYGKAMLERSAGALPGIPEYLGMRITDVGPGFAVCEIELRPELMNPVGVAHGAVIASLVDHVLGAAVVAHLEPGTWPATLEFKLSYLAPAREGTLSAWSEVRSISKRTATVEVECTNAGRVVAIALGTIAITPPKAPPAPKPQET